MKIEIFPNADAVGRHQVEEEVSEVIWPEDDDEVRVKCDHLCRNVRQGTRIATRATVQDFEIPTFEVAEFPHPREKLRE